MQLWEDKNIGTKRQPTTLKVRPRARAVRFLLSPTGKVLLVLLALGITFGSIGFTYYYVKYSRLIDVKLRTHLAENLQRATDEYVELIEALEPSTTTS